MLAFLHHTLPKEPKNTKKALFPCARNVTKNPFFSDFYQICISVIPDTCVIISSTYLNFFWNIELFRILLSLLCVYSFWKKPPPKIFKIWSVYFNKVSTTCCTKLWLYPFKWNIKAENWFKTWGVHNLRNASRGRGGLRLQRCALVTHVKWREMGVENRDFCGA